MCKPKSPDLLKGLVIVMAGWFAGIAQAGVNPVTGLVIMDNPFSTPDYFAIPNFAYSPLPEYCDGNTQTLNCGINGGVPYIGGGMRKFVDALPTLSYDCANPVNQNGIGQCIPIAMPDITSFPQKVLNNGKTAPAADYYSLQLIEYQRQMHSDLPASGTHLRGYRQLPTTGNPTVIPANPQYLGPFIVAQKGKPVRLKFTNSLQSDLPLPVDTSYWGAGSINFGGLNQPASQRRGVIHWHGGDAPWISDGTPHQWITPLNDPTAPNDTATRKGFKKGWGFQNVPDMVTDNPSIGCAASPAAAGECVTPVLPSRNDGVGTYYFPNNLSNRLMWYHDHSFGITRLNVYDGEAAGYLLVDNIVEDALSNLGVPGNVHVNPATGLIDPALSDLGHLLPMIIQDKTYVPDNGEEGGQLAAQDPTWNAPLSPNKIGNGWGKGDLWLPHVYMPNQLPFGITDNSTSPPSVLSTAALGRWDYGMWFAPPILANTPDQACTTTAFTSFGYGPGAFRCPGMPSNNITATPELFLDTPLINGTPYPTAQIKSSAYRFRILNASNDRFWNLNLFYAVTQNPIVVITDTGTPPPGVPAGAGASATATVAPNGTISSISLVDPGAGYSTGPGLVKVAVLQRPVAGPFATTDITLGGSGATGTAIVDPVTQEITSITVDVPGSGYIPSTVCKDIDPTIINPKLCTEVKLVDAVPHRSSGHPDGALPRACTGSRAMNIGQSGLATAPVDSSGNMQYGPTGMPDAGPAGCWPNTWPSDGTGRFGGVPDAATAGPAMIQIGTEGGLLPKAVPIPATPNGFIYDRRMATVLLVSTHGVWLGPAERADFVADFTGMGPTPGKKSVFILYNDSVAPAPLFDPRYDMFTDAADMSGTGGAPSTLPGYGPNTRTTMQFVVSDGNDNKPGKPAFSLAALNAPLTGIPNLFATTEDPIIVPEPSYPSGNGYSPSATTGTYNTFTFPNLQTGTINNVSVTNGGLYSAPPLVSFATVDGVPPTTPAVANATLPNGGLGSIDVVPGLGGLYTSPPNVTLNPQGGASTPTAVLAPSLVTSLSLINGGSGFMSAPTVLINGLYAGTTTISPVGGSVASFSLTEPGAGYVTAPGVSIPNPAPGGVAATATANLAATGQIDTVAGLTSSCAGATGPRAVTFSGGAGAGAAATANVQMLGTLRVTGVTVTNGGANYPLGTTMTVPGCTINSATIRVARAISSFTINNGGSAYSGAPVVTIGPPNALLATNTHTQALASAILSTSGSITSVLLDPASVPATTPQTAPLAVTLSPGTGTGAIISASMAAAPVQSVTLGTGKGSFATPPTVGFICPVGISCGSGAQATATLQPRGILSIAVTNPGAGYKSVPNVVLTKVSATDPGGGVAFANMSPVSVEFKGLVEGFDPVWGTLAIELTSSWPLVPDPQAIAPMPFAFVDPPVDILDDSVPTVWRVDHVGVDTHAIHYHLINAQIINSVDLAGQIYMPDENELGWKETIKYSPFQSRFIAMKAKKSLVPWELPTSIRPMDPTLPLGTVSGPVGCVNNPFAVPPQLGPNCVPFSVVDPQGNAVAVTNDLVNFGYEYVHHCHLLGHEEHDMMRPISFVTNPEFAPILVGSPSFSSPTSTGRATLTWTDTTVSETAFMIEQCFGPSNGATPAACPGTWTTLATQASTTGPTTGTNKTYQTPNLPTGRRYWWRITAVNQVGCISNTCSNPFAGWPSRNALGPIAAYPPVVH